jgi:hypothetical protein
MLDYSPRINCDRNGHHIGASGLIEFIGGLSFKTNVQRCLEANFVGVLFDSIVELNHVVDRPCVVAGISQPDVEPKDWLALRILIPSHLRADDMDLADIRTPRDEPCSQLLNERWKCGCGPSHALRLRHITAGFQC